MHTIHNTLTDIRQDALAMNMDLNLCGLDTDESIQQLALDYLLANLPDALDYLMPEPEYDYPMFEPVDDNFSWD